MPTTTSAFHLMTKPIGPICNIDCKYCFYLEKEHLYPHGEDWRMSDEVLEAYIRDYIGSQDVPEVTFAWQGGEPTLLGVEFFRRAVHLQKQYADGRRIANSFQTNGTLLDDQWCEFLAQEQFLVGLSIDGPRDLHDRYRVDRRGHSTFDAVMKGISRLKKHRVEFNTLTVVNRANSQRPLDVYRFLRDAGSGFIQFIPLVERTSGMQLTIKGKEFAPPPVPGEAPVSSAQVSEMSVDPRQYGEFLVTIFDEWVRRDVGRTFVQTFDVALGNWAGAGPTLCVFSPTCGKAMAIEHNGDVYSCDHYVYPKYKLGNVINARLREMVDSPMQLNFGLEKSSTLPRYCLECPVRFACHGECPKHRFTRTPDGELGLNYLCAAYKRFFTHVDPYMKTMCGLLSAQQPPAAIMQMIREREMSRGSLITATRNDPCPCGSGKKFKKCCGMK